MDIYVDMDDVLSETCRGFLALLEREFDRRVAFEDVRVFDLRVVFDMDDVEIEAFMTRAHEPDVLAAMTPMSGARETLHAWSAAGYGISIMTGRPPSSRRATKEWLDRYEVPHRDLVFVDKYARWRIDPSFREAMTMSELAARRFCLAVEDSGATARFLAEHEVAPVALIDRPWNRDLDGSVRRVNGWAELANIWPDPGF